MSGARRLHRGLAWIAAVAALVWATSGILHPLIVWTGPKPAAFAPPLSGFLAAALPAPATLLAAAGIAEAERLRYLAIDGRPVLQVQRPGSAERRYLDAATGAALADADRAQAERLARHYAGEPQAAVASARLLTRFDADYPPVNRLLPVWRIDFARDDGLAVWVDTGGDRLATLSGSRKRSLQRLFQTLHTLGWLDPLPLLRDTLIGLFSSALLLTAGAGASLLLRPGGQRPARRWHRRFAWLALLPALAFPASGLFHLFAYSGSLPLPATPPLDLAHYTTAPFNATTGAVREAVSLGLRDGPGWQLQLLDGAGPRSCYIAADGTAIAEDEAALVRHWAAAHFGIAEDAVATPTRLLRFSREYGFANKLLPVWRVTGPGDEIAFFDAASGGLSAQVRPLDLAQGLGFDWLHKGQWLDALGLNPDRRNAVLILLALLVLATAAFGLRLRLRLRGVPRREAGAATQPMRQTQTDS